MRLLRRLLIGVFLVLAILILIGSISVYLQKSKTSDRNFSQRLQGVQLRNDSGSIDLSVHSGNGAMVQRRDHFLVLRPKVRERVRNGVLEIDARCRMPFVTCSVDYDLKLPSQADVQVETRRGDIRARGLSGAVKLKSIAGRIEVDDLEGPVRLHTDAGSINGDALASASIRVVANAGSIQLAFVTAPESVVAQTRAGNILLLVPDDGYRIRTEVVAGKASVKVKNAASEPRTITARATAGMIEIRPTS